ncbi:MAG: serine/threonine protein kinase, partial [Elusimicrobia bacterium]|nr:serine/threonine protein kinase [Elusimicrobiota bacterium]
AAGLALLTAGLWRLLPRPGARADGTLAGGRYRLGPVLGEGGMGVVYEATDTVLGRKVAVKRMRPELKAMPRERQRFLDEARAVAKLTHPYIVGLHEVVSEGGEVYIVFDYVEGRPLSAVLAERGRLPPRECRALLEQVCQALDCAHRRGVLHRDLKPSNIMVDAHGFAKVMDFGIAREAKDALTRMTRTQTIVGTPTHMAPEQHLGRAGRSTDVFALGVCLYEMLTGALPYSGPDFLAQKERRAYERPTRLAPELPREADDLVAAALEPDPAKRIADPMELAALLKEIAP